MPSAPNTVNTTRVAAADAVSFSVQVSRLVYPSPTVPWRPNAAVLVPEQPYPYSFMAASLVHFPLNATFLFTPTHTLPPATLEELMRLAPSGHDLPAHVFLVGPFHRAVEDALRRHGFRTLRLVGRDVFETASLVARFRLLTVPPESAIGQRHILVASAETGAEALSATYYAAHNGVPIVFVTREAIPPATQQILHRFADRTFTLFGSENTIGPQVERALAQQVAAVDRVEGTDPFSISVHFARRPATARQLGWGRNQPNAGDAFSFGTVLSWPKTVAGLLLAHQGKHTPLLLIHPRRIPSAVRRYLEALNPVKPRPEPPFLHGFVLGSTRDIPFDVQVALEEQLMAKILEH